MSESDTFSDVDVLREAIRGAMKRLKGGVVAARSGVSRDTIYRFLRGEDVGERTLGMLAEFARRPGVGSSDKSDSADAPVSGPSGGDSGAITIPRDAAFYYRGVLDSELRNLASVGKSIDAVGESLRALRDMLTSATDGMASIAAANVLPPRPAHPPGYQIVPPLTAEEQAEVMRVGDADTQRARDAQASPARTKRTG